ncbi:serine protease [Phenylobacterium sp. LjRoot219]|uniref:trypsin-like serine peptidase n=1 Tax=Phenylobacterium sp. LjRoot219 TaxID=3342283 RepID=UPI003ECFEB32
MATVQIEQNNDSGRRVAGTGFLISANKADGSPRTILVTANHVLEDMKARQARIGFRSIDGDGGWTYTPAELAIRENNGAPLWTKHPRHDIAAITIQAPPAFARAAIPQSYLAADDAWVERNLTAGDELLVLGYPRGLAANAAGFPILRAGRVASFPIAPSRSPTFLLDFSVFPGNSGGPVFLTSRLAKTSDSAPRPPIAGMLIQQVELDRERLEIGIVIHAKYIVETVDMLSGGPRPPPPAADPTPPELVRTAQPVNYSTEPQSAWRRVAERVRRAVAPLRVQVSRLVQLLAEQIRAWADSAELFSSGHDRQAV